MGSIKILRLILSDLSVLQAASLLFAFSIVALYLTAEQLFRPIEKRRSLHSKRYKLPPGPHGLPIVRDLYTLRQGPETALRLGKYGDMTTTHPGSRTWVLINTNRLAHELFNKRGSILNGRPHLPILDDIISRNKRSAWNQVPEWMERRRVMHQLLSGSALLQYAKMQTLESTQLLAEYVHKPEKWYIHHGRFSNSVMCNIALGVRVTGPSKKLADIFRVVTEFVTNSPPFNVIDSFPLLTKLPKMLQPWLKKAQILSDSTFTCYTDYWNPIRRAIEAGEAGPSFARDVLVGNEARYKGTDEDAMYLCIQLIEAGSDTTRISLNIFVLMAVMFPQVYAKARAEIDRVCGANAQRLPVFEDEPQLPYINALAKELMRWKPIFQYPPEHQLTEDLEFEGYYFPKGISFVLNIPMLRSEPGVYDDAEDFRPERFLDGHESDFLHGNWAFGGGRRVCVGYRLAQKSMFINISRLIYCYDYKAVSHTKRHIDPDTSRPLTFIQAGPIEPSKLDLHTQDEPLPIKASPRSAKYAALILKEAESGGVMEDVLNATYQ